MSISKTKAALATASKTTTPDGPDFLCIGQMKAGTAWLYDQLLFQPGFWMPPVKELHYLDKSFPNRKIRNRIDRVLSDFERKSAYNARKEEKGLRALDGRDQAFFEAARDCIDQPSDLDQYAALFRPKGDELSGDITPSYSGIDEVAIERVVDRFPHLKVMILLRHPVQRAISHVAMSFRAGKMPEAGFQDLDAFKKFLSGNSEVLDKSLGTRSVMRWRDRLPPDQFAFFFFDDLVARPEVLRREILSFLGSDPDVANTQFPPNFNRKAKEIKPPLSADILEYLQAQLKEELEQAAQLFGGQAEQWLARYRIEERARSERRTT